MTGIVPPARPRVTGDALASRLAPWPAAIAEPLLLVGIRGYYRDTMGRPGVNDRGVYDDAIIVRSADALATFNANVDPSRIRKGRGTGTQKGMASLQAGFWRAHRMGLHKGTPAFIQGASPVTVTRDGDPDYPETGWFGINIHRGGWRGTSSEGCQTIHPAQWGAFYELVVGELRRHHGPRYRTAVIPYLLLE